MNFFEILSNDFEEDSEFEKYMNKDFNLQNKNEGEKKEANNKEQKNNKKDDKDKDIAKEILNIIEK